MTKASKAWRSFFVDYITSPEARAQFPDPHHRRAAALQAFRRKEIRCECCSKQSVPEVQRFIDILQAPLEEFWREQMTDALDAAVERLRELEDELPTAQVDGIVLSDNKRRDEELLILAFLASLEEAARAPLPANLQLLISQSAEELLRAGAASQGLELDLARVPLARAAARSDLRTLISGRVETRRDEVQAQAREFLRSGRARTPARPGDITEAAEGFQARNLQEWLSENTRIVGLDTQTWLPAAVDQWAYRWFVIGQFQAGRLAGYTELRAVAIVDGVTTRFCLWVNGRTISVSKAEDQLNEHIRVSIQGDIDALMKNWPMLSSEIVQSKDRAVLRKAYTRVGLPPYHFKCRTLVRWVQAGR